MWCLLNKNPYFCSMLQFENQKIKQIVRKVLPVVTLGAMLYSCASIGRPDGGPYDETPPRFIGSTPEAGALNNKRAKVSLMFDEFIKLEKATEKVVVSPPQIQQPEIKASGKRIQVNLLDSLKPNTTYTIDFSDAIVDNNEGNPLGNFAFTFSTGTEIDTMEVAGTMLDASNLEPIKGMLVGLHSNLNDSAFNKLPFDRVARTDSRGRFSIRGVAPGKYRIYGLMDADQNFTFNQKSEMIAFHDSLIIPRMEERIRMDTAWVDSLTYDTIVEKKYMHYLPDDVILRAFKELNYSQYLIKSERLVPHKFTFYFAGKADTLPVLKGLNFDEKDAFVIEKNQRNDTIHYWVKDSLLFKQDTLAMSLTYLYTDTLNQLVPRTDTLNLVSKQKYKKEELEEMGYVHKEFSDELSPEFQEAVEESTKKVQEFSVYLHEIGFDGIMTQEETDGFTKRVNDMCSEVISTIESRKEEAQSGLKDLFIADDQVIDESEQKVLELLSQSSDAQISEVQTLQDEILAIQQNAANEKRQLKEQEIADIQNYNEQIRQIELEALGGTEQEILYAKNEFAARVRTMDLESASELLQEKAKIRDDEIVQIQAAYDTEIQLLQSKLSTCKEEDRAYYEEQIANLEQDKQKKITEQRDLYDEYLSIIEEYNPKLLDGISDLNGQILTGEEERNAEYLQKVQERYAGLEQITESGCYTLYNMEKGTNEDIVVNYDQATGKIVGLYHEASSTLVGYSKEIQGATVEMALNGKGSFEMLGTSLDGLKEKNGELVNANGDVVSSLSDIKKSADGTREGIAILNGTPCEVKVNKDGTIANLRAIDEEANNATRARTLSITLATNAITSGINAAISAAQGYSHYNGLDNVPYDGYQAVLHKGERVLTAEENKAYSNDPGIDYNKMEKCMKSAVRELTLSVGSRELGRIIDEHLRERGIL